jgi:hypothetical protein
MAESSDTRTEDAAVRWHAMHNGLDRGGYEATDSVRQRSKIMMETAATEAREAAHGG